MGIIEELLGLGIEWVEDLGDEVKQWADDPKGKAVLRALASSLTGGLAPVLGPQLATVAWSLPGLARGEPFDEAWWTEFCWRVETTAEILQQNYALPHIEEMKRAGKQLLAQAEVEFPDLPVAEALSLIPFDVKKFAASLDIREDISAYAISLGRRTPPPERSRYDTRTGKRVPLVSLRQALAIIGIHRRVSLREIGAGATTNGSLVRALRSIP